MINDSLKKRYIFKLSANIISGIINALLIAMVPKALGPLAYGHFNFLQQFFSQIISFLDANSSTAFFTKLSAKNNRRELIVFYSIVSLLMLFAIVFLLFLIELIGVTNYVFTDLESKYIYLGMFLGFLTWLTQVYIKISDAYALTVSVEVIKVVHKILMVCSLFYVINYFTLGLELYLAFQITLSLLLLFILTVLFFQRGVFSCKINNYPISFKSITKEFYDFCSPMFVFNVIAISLGLFDIWLLQRIAGSVQVGFYGLAYSIAAMCFLFTSAMTPIIMREFSKSIELKNLKNVRKLFGRYVPMLYAIAAYFSVFVAYHAEDLLLIFADERYNGAYMALVIMAFYPLHQTYGQINSALLFSAEKVVIYKNIGLVFSLLGLIVTLVLVCIFDLGAEGMAWKMLLVQVLSVNVQLYYNSKYLGVKLQRYIVHQVLCVGFFIIIGYITKFSLFTYPTLNFLFSGVMYTILAAIFSFYFPSLFGGKRKKRRSKC